MTLHDSTEVRAPIIKLISAWGLTLFTEFWHAFQSVPWDLLGKFAVFIYTLVLILEVITKRARRKRESDGSE